MYKTPDPYFYRKIKLSSLPFSGVNITKDHKIK